MKIFLDPYNQSGHYTFMLCIQLNQGGPAKYPPKKTHPKKPKKPHLKKTTKSGFFWVFLFFGRNLKLFYHIFAKYQMLSNFKQFRTFFVQIFITFYIVISIVRCKSSEDKKISLQLWFNILKIITGILTFNRNQNKKTAFLVKLHDF